MRFVWPAECHALDPQSEGNRPVFAGCILLSGEQDFYKTKISNTGAEPVVTVGECRSCLICMHVRLRQATASEGVIYQKFVENTRSKKIDGADRSSRSGAYGCS